MAKKQRKKLNFFTKIYDYLIPIKISTIEFSGSIAR